MALTKDNQVILLEQFRPGPKKILSELPGGFVDKGEDPTVAAERELNEETGYAGTCQLILKFHDCAYSTRRRFCFLATDCEKVAEPQEQEISTKLVSLDEFRDKVFNGEMTDTACALAALAKSA